MKKKELKGRKTYLEVDDEKFATAMIVFESMKIKRETREREREMEKYGKVGENFSRVENQNFVRLSCWRKQRIERERDG